MSFMNFFQADSLIKAAFGVTKTKNNLLIDPIAACLYRLSMPMIVSMVALMGFNLIDAYYIGLLGRHELAALAFTLPITSSVFALNLGLSSGVSAILSRIFGQKDRGLAKRVITHSLFYSVIILGAFSVSAYFAIDWIFPALGAGQELMPFIRQYMSVWLLGIVFLVIPMVINGALRASGDARSPSFIMSVSAVINGIIDPLLIFGLGPFPKLGLQGAALSSVCAWIFSATAALFILIRREKLLDFSKPSWPLLQDSWRRLFTIALPAILNNLMAPVAMALLVALVAQFGPDAVAATGVGARFEPLVLIVVMSMTSAVGVMVGQNLGASQLDRVRAVVRTGFGFAVLWQMGVGVVLALSASVLATAFSDSDGVAQVLKHFLWIQPVSYSMLAVAMLSVSILNAMHQPMLGILVSAVRLFGLMLPCAYLGGLLMGVTGVYLGVAVSNAVIGLLSYLLMKQRLRLLDEAHAEAAAVLNQR